ncbi:hypothetical protein [Spiroplasma endosymbiont of Tipula paludosa]|uniref:hypothetical protein n=1 Tax=Spiroplasma endosymbiont of Tipula paludosa TaxID=3066295 RepID=UPI0035C93C4C
MLDKYKDKNEFYSLVGIKCYSYVPSLMNNSNSNQNDTFRQEVLAILDDRARLIGALQNAVGSVSTQMKVLKEDAQIMKQQLSWKISEKTDSDLILENDNLDDDSVEGSIPPTPCSELFTGDDGVNDSKIDIIADSELELRLALLKEIPIADFMSNEYFENLLPKMKIAHTFWLQNNFKLNIDSNEYFLWMAHIKKSDILENQTLLKTQSKKLMEWELIKFKNNELIEEFKNKLLNGEVLPILKKYLSLDNIYMVQQKMNHKYSKNEKNFSNYTPIDFNDKDFILTEDKLIWNIICIKENNIKGYWHLKEQSLKEQKISSDDIKKLKEQ